MEKRAVIEEGLTPPEKTDQPQEKRASQDLGEHVTRRLAEAAARRLTENATKREKK